MNRFEQLIEYVINDEDAKARELFHDIVVEKSREIYENLMQEEEAEDDAVADAEKEEKTFEGEEDDTDESMGLREYRETVGNDWHKNGMKGETGKMAGAGSGENENQGGKNTKSVVSSGKGKPTTGATAGNILGDSSVGTGKNTGTSPDSLNKGIAQVAGEKFAKGMNNVDGVKSGVKTLAKQGAGYPGNNKTPGPVGSGSGDKAGQTSVGQVKSPLNGAPNRNA